MVRHILADGREVPSIEGYVIPTDGITAAVYHAAVEILKRHAKNEKKENETQKTA